jgi:hypothetical protein
MKNLTDVVVFFVELLNGFHKALGDGKITLVDAPDFWPATFDLLPALKDIGQIKEEWANHTPEDEAVLVAEVKARLKLDHPNVEAWVDQVIAQALALVDLVEEGVKLFEPVQEDQSSTPEQQTTA